MRWISALLLFMVVFIAAYSWQSQSVVAETVTVRPLPEFTQTEASQWVNTKPLTVDSLRGNVLLVDVWTFDCWNCYRSFPWLRSLETKFSKQNFKVIGIHTPEFDHEKQYKNVVKHVQKFKLHHPVMLDNDFAYWRALNNRYWPSFYLVDKQSRIRHVFVGETHANQPRAKKIEKAIQQLLAE